ncbi:hypothetical protein Llan_1814 [Legionella lansingensis]|uniref:Uncharacterized protein n=1 Tax=Legionella lansingensis TaxID=45067 RepID=A0A0W0VKD2_9GAMM|nr:hypothetical protein Llan_1814 [Legionella lansingensis]
MDGAQGRSRTGTEFNPPRDFKSLASTCFATWAFYWRLRPESNRRPRLCRPLHNHSATQPKLNPKKKSDYGVALIWSGKRDSNSRPQPWQGCALPTELFPPLYGLPFYRKFLRCQQVNAKFIRNLNTSHKFYTFLNDS